MFSVIVQVRVVLRKTVVGDLRFDYLRSCHLTLKMTTAQVTSITNNSLSQEYPHPDDHAKHIS